MDLCWQVMSLLLNMLSRLIITLLPMSKRLLISWLQSPSAVTLEPRKIKSATAFTVSPSIFHEVMGPDTMIFIFWMLSFKPTFSCSSFTFSKRLFSSSSLSAIRMVSSAYLMLLIFLPAILIAACASCSPVFLMMYTSYKLNKQGVNIQPWCTLFPICNRSVVPCPVLTVASWPAYSFLKRQVRWSGILISFRIFQSLFWSTQYLESILKSIEITLLTKIYIVKLIFSSSQVWIWDLDHEVSWASENWCFWAVVLDKAFGNALDCKDIKPVYPKGNQPWIFTGSIDAEAEAPIFWPPDVKCWLIRKYPDYGKDWR